MSLPRTSTVNIAVLVAGVIAAITLVWIAPAPTPQPAAAEQRTLLDAFPAGAAFVLTADLDRVRRTSLGALLAGGGREIPGLGPLDELCGFDPTTAARELAFVVPGLKGSSDVGVAAAGDFDGARLVRCVQTVVSAHGGEPLTTPVSSFITIRDGSARAEGVVAVRDHGPVLLGADSYLRTMIATFDGAGRSLRDDVVHAAMRRELGPGAAVTASWAMAPSWLVDVTGSEMAKVTPLASARTLVVRADFDDGLEINASLGCPNPEICSAISDQLTTLHRDLGPDATRAFGTDVLGSVKITPGERNVRLSLKLDRDHASAALDHALMQLKAFQPPPVGSGSPTFAPPADERIVAPH